MEELMILTAAGALKIHWEQPVKLRINAATPSNSQSLSRGSCFPWNAQLPPGHPGKAKILRIPCILPPIPTPRRLQTLNYDLNNYYTTELVMG